MKRDMSGHPVSEVSISGCGLTMIVRCGNRCAIIVEGPARAPPVAAYCVQPVKKICSEIGDVRFLVEKGDEAAEGDKTIPWRARRKKPAQPQGM